MRSNADAMGVSLQQSFNKMHEELRRIQDDPYGDAHPLEVLREEENIFEGKTLEEVRERIKQFKLTNPPKEIVSSEEEIIISDGTGKETIRIAAESIELAFTKAQGELRNLANTIIEKKIITPSKIEIIHLKADNYINEYSAEDFIRQEVREHFKDSKIKKLRLIKAEKKGLFGLWKSYEYEIELIHQEAIVEIVYNPKVRIKYIIRYIELID